MKALLVGGTGPTGPYLLQGLLDRGYEVTIFHRGVHEAEGLPPVEHIHGDPHFQETIEEALQDRTFDLVLATYGRIRYLAEALAGRCRRFLAIGGVAAYRGLMEPEKLHPYGMKVLTKEHEDLATDPGGGSGAARFGYLVYATERRVLALHDAGAFQATIFRYPQIYGPRQLRPNEWSVIKRVLDRREYMILPDGGLAIVGRCAARNAAHCVLLAVDRPEAAAGQVYNCADEDQFTLRQWMELIVEFTGGALKPLSMPDSLAKPARPLFPLQTAAIHSLVDITKAKTELGYRDALPAREALREAVEWLLANPVTPDQYPNFRDRFDYAAEDRLIAAYLKSLAELEQAHPFELPVVAHSYAHPKEPRQQRDHRGR